MKIAVAVAEVVVILLMPINAFPEETQLERSAREMGIISKPATPAEKPKSTAECPSGLYIKPEKIKARGLKIIPLSPEYKKNVIHYLNMTTGNPPDLSKAPGYKIYFIHDQSGQWCDHGVCSPPSQGAIDITAKNNCIFYRIRDTTESLGHIITGTWHL